MSVLERAAPVVLIAAAGASAVLMLGLGAGITFFGDEWDLILHRRDWDPDAFLRPHNEHLHALPIAAYKGLLGAFGMESALPFKALATSILLASAGLLFVYMRRRVGAWPALLGTVVVLFLGAAWEVLLWPFGGIVWGGATACGLGMLLALQREDRLGDILASGLLAGSLAFGSLGIAFAAGAATEVALRRGRWRRRALLVAIPLALYALWYVGWGHEAGRSVPLSNVVAAPRFVIEALAASTAALLGLFSLKQELRTSGLGRPLLFAGGALLIGVGAAVAWRVHGSVDRLQTRLRGAPRWLWVAVVILLSFWILAALNQVFGRTPSASRYQYPGAVLILVVIAEALRGVRIGKRTTAAVTVLAVASVLGNLIALRQGERLLSEQSELARAELGALEIARDRAPRALTLGPGVSRSPHLAKVDAGSYYLAVDAYGSPADTPAQLLREPEAARAAADIVLVHSVRPRLERVATPGRRVQGGSGPGAIESGGTGRPDARCTQLGPAGAGPAELALPEGRAVIRTRSGQGALVVLRRFGSEAVPFPGAALAAGSAARVRIPSDRAAQPWRLAVRASRAVTVCKPA